MRIDRLFQAGVAGLLVAALAIHGCTSLDGLSGGDRGDAAIGSDGGLADAVVPGVPPPGVPPAPGTDASTTPLGPGQIACASTTTVCDVRQAQCCVTIIGTSSAATRSLTASMAKCGAVDGGGCGGNFVKTNDTFTEEFDQRCASARDCKTGESCCVVPMTSPLGRFGQFVQSITCVPAAQCATTGRAICAGPGDCTPQENCLPETDAILVRLYGSFCQ